MLVKDISTNIIISVAYCWWTDFVKKAQRNQPDKIDS